MQKPIITLDASLWQEKDDFYEQLLPQLGAPSWHGHNLDALWDSLRDETMNQVTAPFTIHILNQHTLSDALYADYIQFKKLIHELPSEGVFITLEEE